MNTTEWFHWRDLDKEAMLHVEGRKPKLVCRDWPWRAINLYHAQPLEVKGED